ncbi:MAG: DUF550 domain-containing protein [Firmicutes bacterium]|nr:DUF550 domain-containing protein [Bacillota bacterium]
MAELSISELMQRQAALYEKHRQDWDPRDPEHGKDSLLWMVDELGEVIAIIKKKGPDAIMEDAHVRAHYVEECSDVFMYFLDMLQCYGIGAEEFTTAFDKKWHRNMNRTWEENNAMYED